MEKRGGDFLFDNDNCTIGIKQLLYADPIDIISRFYKLASTKKKDMRGVKIA